MSKITLMHRTTFLTIGAIALGFLLASIGTPIVGTQSNQASLYTLPYDYSPNYGTQIQCNVGAKSQKVIISVVSANGEAMSKNITINSNYKVNIQTFAKNYGNGMSLSRSAGTITFEPQTNNIECGSFVYYKNRDNGVLYTTQNVKTSDSYLKTSEIDGHAAITTNIHNLSNTTADFKVFSLEEGTLNTVKTLSIPADEKATVTISNASDYVVSSNGTPFINYAERKNGEYTNIQGKTAFEASESEAEPKSTAIPNSSPVAASFSMSYPSKATSASPKTTTSPSEPIRVASVYPSLLPVSSQKPSVKPSQYPSYNPSQKPSYVPSTVSSPSEDCYCETDNGYCFTSKDAATAASYYLDDDDETNNSQTILKSATTDNFSKSYGTWGTIKRCVFHWCPASENLNWGKPDKMIVDHGGVRAGIGGRGDCYFKRTDKSGTCYRKDEDSKKCCRHTQYNSEYIFNTKKVDLPLAVCEGEPNKLP